MSFQLYGKECHVSHQITFRFWGGLYPLISTGYSFYKADNFCSGFSSANRDANDVVQLAAFSHLPQQPDPAALQLRLRATAAHQAAEHHRLPPLLLPEGPGSPLTKLSQVFQSVRRGLKQTDGKLDKQKNCSMHFSLSEITRSRKILCAASD